MQNKKIIVVLAVAVVAAMTMAVYSMDVQNFADYKPPTSLVFEWYDYFKDSLHSGPSANNQKTAWPRWSAEYPYRAIFFGARPVQSSYYAQYHDGIAFIVWSKTPVTNLFTFSYTAGDKTKNQNGRIRASYDRTKLLDDVRIMYCQFGGVPSGTLEMGQLSVFATYRSDLYISGGKSYFEFDFYYVCSDKHQQNAAALNVNGAKTVPSVPYGYLLTCAAHGGSGSSTGSGQSGSSSTSSSQSSSSSSQSSSSSSSSSSGSSSGSSSSSSSSSGSSGGSSSGDSSSEPSGSLPDSGDYGDDTGDTGENGGGWQLPKFGDDDGVSGEAGGFKDLQPGTKDWGMNELKPGTDDWGLGELKPGTNDWGLGELKPGTDDWGLGEWKPNGEYGLIDFMNP